MTDRDGCIALNLVPGIGFSRFQMLSEWFGAPGQVFNHAQEEYEKLKNFGNWRIHLCVSMSEGNSPGSPKKLSPWLAPGA